MRLLLCTLTILAFAFSAACARATPVPIQPTSLPTSAPTTIKPTSTPVPPSPTLQPTPNTPSLNDFTSGTIHCNDEAINIRSSIALWELQSKKLTILLFQSLIDFEIVKYWTETYQSPQSSINSTPSFKVSVYPTDKKYFAKLELTMHSTAIRGSQDNIQSYFFYIDCPTAQLNINRSFFTDPKRMANDFPKFEGNLQTGGYIKFAMKEAEIFSLVNTRTKWDLDVNTILYTR